MCGRTSCFPDVGHTSTGRQRLVTHGLLTIYLVTTVPLSIVQQFKQTVGILVLIGSVFGWFQGPQMLLLQCFQILLLKWIVIS